MRKIIILLFCSPFIVFSQEDLKYYEQYMPSSGCGEIINYSYYSVSFCEEYSSSEWTIHYITNNRPLGVVSRSDSFRKDILLKGRDADLSDYKRSGYDRGHLVPAGDMSFNQIAMSESFYMTNIIPQSPSINRGGWRALETKIREWALELDSVVIITGWIKNNIKTYIGGNNIPVPGSYYKVFVDVTNKRSIAIIMPNEKLKKPILEYVVSIGYLECLTGLDFFYKLPDDIELSLEIDSGIKDITSASQCKGRRVDSGRCCNKTKNKNGYCFFHEDQSP